MIERIIIKIAAWKLAGFFRGKKTYLVAALAVGLGVGILTGHDTAAVQKLLAQGGEADPVAVLSALLGLGLMALRSGVKQAAKEQEQKLDTIIKAEQESKCGSCGKNGVQRKVTAKDIT